ncbi:MAG: hypothetical protein JST25_05785, partial [Actinobacteria bacterium]|nr:hypothetical protein [Actinomycetota bacterium]
DAERVFRTRLPTAGVRHLDGSHNLQETAPTALAEIIRTIVDADS